MSAWADADIVLAAPIDQVVAGAGALALGGVGDFVQNVTNASIRCRVQSGRSSTRNTVLVGHETRTLAGAVAGLE